MKVLLIAVFASIVFAMAPEASAACMDCCLPPPYTAIRCCGTMWDGGTGCIIFGGGTACTRIGSCSSGNGPDPCLETPSLPECTLEQWSCRRPRFRELRVVRVEVQQPRSGRRS